MAAAVALEVAAADSGQPLTIVLPEGCGVGLGLFGLFALVGRLTGLSGCGGVAGGFGWFVLRARGR
jgi:hypothetical protein